MPGVGENVAEISAVGITVITKKTNLARRIIWLLLILAATGFFIYHVKKRVENYLSDPTTIEYRKEYGQVALPAVTVCNMNRLIHLDLTSIKETRDLIADTFPQPLNSDKYDKFTGGFRNLFQSLQNKNSDVEDLAKKFHFLSKKLTNKIHKILFDYQSVENFTLEDNGLFSWNKFMENQGHPVVVTRCQIGVNQCKDDDIEEVVDSTYGRCLILNKNRTFNQTYPGDFAGIQLDLVALSKAYFKPSPSMYGYNLFLVDGIEQISFPILLSAGMFHDVVISSTKFEHIKNCVTNEEMKLQYFKTYTPYNCVIENYIRSQVDECNCHFPGMAEVNKKDCPLTSLQCALENYINADHSRMSNCKPLCHHLSYKHMITSVTDRNRNKSEKTNYLTVFIHYNDLSQTIQVEKVDNEYKLGLYTYDWLALLSDIGGASGLFLGACIFTLVQLIDVAATAIANYVKLSKKRSKTSDNTVEKSQE